MNFIESLIQNVSVVKSCIPPFLNAALHTNLPVYGAHSSPLLLNFISLQCLVSKQ